MSNYAVPSKGSKVRHRALNRDYLPSGHSVHLDHHQALRRNVDIELRVVHNQ
jgi:hypothetical protein